MFACLKALGLDVTTNDDDYKGTSISEMLAFLRNDISLDEGEIINQGNSYNPLLASSQYSTASITCDQIKRFTKNDEKSTTFAKLITTGCPGPQDSLPQDLRGYWPVCGHLQVKDQVPVISERVIIPKGLRQRVLDTLHSANQGVYRMMLRAQETVY